MTAGTGVVVSRRAHPAEILGSLARRNAWALGLVGTLAVLVVFTRLIQPTYGVAGVQGLAISVLPLALAAAAQSVIVISGGIDLSIGSMMALTSVVAAVGMQGQSEAYSLGVVAVVLLFGVVLGAINGGLVVLTRVPDIIVTLATSFIWWGASLRIISTPGGGAARWLKDLILGSLGSEWIPKSAIVLLVAVALVWLPVQRSRLGLSLYAIGSNQLAAFRGGVSVGRTKILGYAIGGLFAALAGLSLTASTGIGTPVPGPDYTLLSVAAAVLGGVSLAGGRGGLLGPIMAVVILQLIRTDLTFLKVNPNMATVVNGAILVGVVMLGSFVQFRRQRA